MELHQLRYFVAVANTGNFSRAAEHCHVSQPSLSQQIHKLELELGERLIDRLPRQAKLTAAGEAFLERARRVLVEVAAAEREARDSGGLPRGVIQLGVLPTLAPYLLPGVLSGFWTKYPSVRLIILEDTTAQLVRLGAEAELDLFLASSPQAGDERFAEEVLFDEEMLLAMPEHHPLARQDQIRLLDLESEPFILMREGHCLGDQVLNFCHRRDFHPRISGRSTQVETILALVEAGLGVSLVPAMAFGAAAARRVICRSLEEPRPRRQIGVFWLHTRSLSRPATEFLNHLRQTLKAGPGGPERGEARSGDGSAQIP